MKMEELIRKWQEIIVDPNFAFVQEWKDRTRRKSVAYFPVYTPMEIFYAAGLLPVGIMGAGNQLEIVHADARFGSFICSIVKSTMELGLRGNLKVFDGMFFHSICDSARNLAFLFRRNFSPPMRIEYIHFPQNADSSAAIDYFENELARVRTTTEEIAEVRISDEDLRASITVYNENRTAIRSLYRFRNENPHLISTTELYILVRAGHYMPPEEHTDLLHFALRSFAERTTKPRDRIRVVLEGSFCEQPPLELLMALEDAGCAIVDDDLLLGRRWFLQDVSTTGNPLRCLAESYARQSCYSSVRHDWKHPRTEGLLQKVKQSQAEAVVFCIAKFCEPAYFDYVLFKDALDARNIPHLLIEFEEKMWTFEKARTEIETFVESILFE